MSVFLPNVGICFGVPAAALPDGFQKSEQIPLCSQSP